MLNEYPNLFVAAFTQPAIDNHAHPLLREPMRDKLAFEGLISEAEGDALTEDAIHTLACYRATKQLAQLYGLDPNSSSWEDVKLHREKMDYTELCKLAFKEAEIHCILIDDGLGGVAQMAEDYKWHDQLTTAPTRRIVRVEIVAEEILKGLFSSQPDSTLAMFLGSFEDALMKSLSKSALESDVVAFKSIVCYRTGMNVSPTGNETEKKDALLEVLDLYRTNGTIRLAHKPLNDEVVRIALGVAGRHKIPGIYGKTLDDRMSEIEGDDVVQFHTGLGDNDITLSLSSPAHLQPIIKLFPDTTFVLLHSSYPYTREAGYLTAVYRNVYLDFGEVFPFVSSEGQRSIIRQVLELSPTNKIMWSSDGHWWPESYYLGIFQAREALYEVLVELVKKGDITESEGVEIVKKSLFSNALRVYQL